MLRPAHLFPIGRRRLFGAAALLLALVGCGGGFYLGSGSSNDDPPQVSLVVSPQTVAPGDTLQLRAAASDDFGIDRVTFFQIDTNNISTPLGDDDTTAPYGIDVTVDNSASGTLQFFARAEDTDGQTRDSDVVSVSVNR